MKRIVILIIVCLYSLSLEAAENSGSSFREEIFALNQNSSLAFELLEKLEKIEDPSPLIYAYKGVCEAHIAKVVSNPFEKVFYIFNANKNLTLAVGMNEKNLEVRFLRYAVQIQSPKLFGLQKDIVEDGKIIMNNFSLYDWSLIDHNIISYICYFMIDIGECDEHEKKQLIDFMEKRNLIHSRTN